MPSCNRYSRQRRGPGDAWSPEHLLLAAVSACFLFTFRPVAKASHVDFVDVEAHATGNVDRVDGVTRLSHIGVHPTVTVPKGADLAAAHRAIDKTAARCLVSSSLATPVQVEATIRESAASAAA